MRLGIRPELIEPAHPEQNGRHERMHKTLKADTARPPQGDLGVQQRCFDRFRHGYNTERPHEALADATPASCYTPSPHPYRATLPPLVYPGHFDRRLVSRNGGIRWRSRWVNASHLFAALEIAPRKSTTASGTSTSARSGSGASTKRSGASLISSDGRFAARETTIKEGTTTKRYPSAEHTLSPITWTVHEPCAVILWG